MPMEGYYSSDDDVAWGPYTIREAKRDIRETVPSKIERRHTYSGKLNKEDNLSRPLRMETPNQRFENEIATISQKTKSQLNISGTSSEYFTPNETFKSGPTSVDDFLDKMKKAIEEPTKIDKQNEDVPEKDTLADVAKSNVNDDTGLVDEIISASHPHLTNQRRQGHSIYNLLRMANPGRGKDSMLGNVEPTLVDNTVIISSDEEDDEIGKVGKLSDSYLVNNSCYNTSSEVEMIEISDTSFTEANLTNLENSFYRSDMKTETNDEYDILPQNNNLHDHHKESELKSNEENISDFECHPSKLESLSNVLKKKQTSHYKHDINIQKDIVHLKNNTNIDGDDEIQFSSLESVSNDKPDIEYIIKRLSKDLQDEDVETDSLSEDSVDDSKVCTSDFDELKIFPINEKAASEIHQPPEINIESYSESSPSQNSSMAFNDTLEEMEMVLKYGIDYKMPNDYINSDKHTNHNTSYDDNSESNDKMRIPAGSVAADNATSLGSRIPKPVAGNYDTKIAKNNLPLRNPIVQQEHAKGYFKVPCTPSRQGVTPTKSPLSHNKKFKDIMSPVGIYIKHSPAPVIKRTVVPKDISRSPIIPKEKISKNTGMPHVIYRPAKKNVVHREKEIVLGQSIRKMICEPGITKHEGRITSKVRDTPVDMMLGVIEQELTCASINETDLNITGDISFITKKQGFKK